MIFPQGAQPTTRQQILIYVLLTALNTPYVLFLLLAFYGLYRMIRSLYRFVFNKSSASKQGKPSKKNDKSLIQKVQNIASGVPFAATAPSSSTENLLNNARQRVVMGGSMQNYGLNPELFAQQANQLARPVRSLNCAVMPPAASLHHPRFSDSFDNVLGGEGGGGRGSTKQVDRRQQTMTPVE